MAWQHALVAVLTIQSGGRGTAVQDVLCRTFCLQSSRLQGAPGRPAGTCCADAQGASVGSEAVPPSDGERPPASEGAPELLQSAAIH